MLYCDTHNTSNTSGEKNIEWTEKSIEKCPDFSFPD